MARPRAGDLKYVVDIERREITEGGTGDPVVTWVPLAKNVRAGIRSLSVREFLAGLAVTSQVSVMITIYWRDDIDQTMRIKRHIHNRTTPRKHELYNLAGPGLDIDRKWMLLPATLGVNDG